MDWSNIVKPEDKYSITTRSLGVRGALLVQFGSKYANVAVQLVISMVLARILTPEEYGLQAIVSVFTTFFSMFADMGIGPAIIQYDLDEDELNALFAFTGLFGFVLMGIFCILAIPISLFYDDSRLVGLCMFASVSILFNAANMVPNGILLKRSLFIVIGIRLLVSTVIGGTFAIVMATMGFGTYALVANSIVTAATVLFWNMLASGVRVGNFHFVDPLRKVLRYSAYQTGFQVVNYFSRNLDNLLIGRFVGVTDLGFYDKAYKLTTYPMSFVSGVVASVLQPFLAKYQDDEDALYDRWARVSKSLSLLAAPVAAFFFTATSEIVIVMYGDQWANSVPLLHALSVSIYFQMVNNASGAIFQASNHTDYLFKHSLVATAITVTMLLVGLSTGDVSWVAWCISLAFSLHIFSTFYFLIHRSLHASVLGYAQQFAPELAAAALACMVCALLSPFFHQNAFVSLAEKVLVLVAIMGPIYVTTGQVKYLRDAFGKKS